MAQSLRLHFAARRSNTYPSLSETSGDDLDSSIHMCSTRPARISTGERGSNEADSQTDCISSVNKGKSKSRKITLSSPENVYKKSSCLQISLQPTRYSGCLQSGNVLADGDDASFTCVLKDGAVQHELNATDDGNLLSSPAICSGSLITFQPVKMGLTAAAMVVIMGPAQVSPVEVYTPTVASVTAGKLYFSTN